MASKHLVAIFGGAVSGAEAAHQLTEKGIPCVVFEQNMLPYGKIEDGLPKWHVKLRDKEEGRIDEKLSHPLVTYVPGVRLGREVIFEDVAKNWGFSAVLLAIGAWRDRPLPLEGVDAYEDKGLIYQNPFIYWFNHYHEPNFAGQQYDIRDGAIVVGGGLASLDVVKVLMIESVKKALNERGHDISLFDLDRSISKTLDDLGIPFEDLELKGCTLYYRRRAKDMPLSPMPTDTPEQLAKAEMVREKILNNFVSKYLFKVQTQRVPCDLIVEEGQLKGLVFQETKIDHGRAVPVPGTETEVRGPYVISSIGSIPEMIDGIPARGSVYDIADDSVCRISGYPNVFALGNAVTGRGNINESLKHGREITQKLIESYLSAPLESAARDGVEIQKNVVEKAIDGIVAKIDPLAEGVYPALMKRIKSLQEKVGYDGDYMQWIEKHRPVRLEELISEK